MKIKDNIPKTGFNVIKIWEDMDCITPIDDEHFIVGNKDTLEEALILANQLYSVFGITYVLDSNGKKLDRNYAGKNIDKNRKYNQNNK